MSATNCLNAHCLASAFCWTTLLLCVALFSTQLWRPKKRKAIHMRMHHSLIEVSCINIYIGILIICRKDIFSLHRISRHFKLWYVDSGSYIISTHWSQRWRRSGFEMANPFVPLPQIVKNSFRRLENWVRWSMWNAYQQGKTEKDGSQKEANHF